MHFIPCDDSLLFTPLIGNSSQTPVDFPEFQVIVGTLGGLEARVDLPNKELVSPISN
jgi:hypothetical protein